jgi:hypothetical protein
VGEKTTHSSRFGASTISPAGSRHAMPAGTCRVLVIQSMSAGITSDPSQPERPGGGARLFSGGGEVAVILQEAIDLAGIHRDSRSHVMLALTKREEGEVSLFQEPKLIDVSKKVRSNVQDKSSQNQRKLLPRRTPSNICAVKPSNASLSEQSESVCP